MISFEQFLDLAEGKKKERKRLEQYSKDVRKSVKKQQKSGQGIISFDHPTASPSAPGSPERQAEIDAMMKFNGAAAIKKAMKKNPESFNFDT